MKFSISHLGLVEKPDSSISDYLQVHREKKRYWGLCTIVISPGIDLEGDCSELVIQLFRVEAGTGKGPWRSRERLQRVRKVNYIWNFPEIPS